MSEDEYSNEEEAKQLMVCLLSILMLKRSQLPAELITMEDAREDAREESSGGKKFCCCCCRLSESHRVVLFNMAQQSLPLTFTGAWLFAIRFTFKLRQGVLEMEIVLASLVTMFVVSLLSWASQTNKKEVKKQMQEDAYMKTEGASDDEEAVESAPLLSRIITGSSEAAVAAKRQVVSVANTILTLGGSFGMCASWAWCDVVATWFKINKSDPNKSPHQYITTGIFFFLAILFISVVFSFLASYRSTILDRTFVVVVSCRRGERMGYEYQLLLLLQILFLTPVGKGAHFLLQASTGISRSSPAAIIWGKATLVAFFAPIFVIMLNKFALIEGQKMFDPRLSAKKSIEGSKIDSLDTKTVAREVGSRVLLFLGQAYVVVLAQALQDGVAASYRFANSAIGITLELLTTGCLLCLWSIFVSRSADSNKSSGKALFSNAKSIVILFLTMALGIMFGWATRDFSKRMMKLYLDPDVSWHVAIPIAYFFVVFAVGGKILLHLSSPRLVHA